MVILKRIGADSEYGSYGCWPHVLVKDVRLDLAKTPWLTWRLLETGMKANGYAVKVTDLDSSKTVELTEMDWPPFHDYRAYDLRKVFGVKNGTHAFQIKFYFLGISFESSTKCLTAKHGDYLAVAFLRAEAE